MEFKELEKKEPAMLQKFLEELREKQHELKFKVANNQLKNLREIRVVKKNIAQVLFLLKQKMVAKTDKPKVDQTK